MVQNPRGWIIDGNYGVLGTLIPDNATDIICKFVKSCVASPTYTFDSTGLDPPLWYYLPRLLWRTFMRLLGLTCSCAEGCKETWGNVFSSESIVWFCVTNHAIARIKYKTWLSRMSVEVGGKMRHLDESRGELAGWKDDLEHHVRQM